MYRNLYICKPRGGERAFSKARSGPGRHRLKYRLRLSRMSLLCRRPAPPDAPSITAYDRAHVSLYLRLLDAEASRAAWDDAAHLARAR